MVVSVLGRHLELLARIHVEFDAKGVALGVGTVKREQVPVRKFLARCLKLWRVVVKLAGLSVDENLHWIASFFLVIKAGQHRPAPHLLQN